MRIKTLTPRQSLNKAFLKEKIARTEFDLLKTNLSQLFSKIDVEESEENSKTILRDFLNNIHYQDKHHINTLRDVDLVIFHENNQNKPAVLLEVKRPKNKTEMITKDNLNAKAMHELIRYFLEERIEFKNNELKYLIATNINEWFIFDAALFESLFFKNKALVKDYQSWRDKQKVSGNTDLFYNEIAKPFLASLQDEITFAYFNLEDHKKLIKKDDNESEKLLISVYKILSPAHLLKKPFVNDSNTLDRNFYTELLHIIGLIETKDKNKKLISRKPEKERNHGSILENAIVIIETDNILSRLKNVEKYGADKEERLFNLALELSITWINRILFLKLLEAQLFKYQGDEKYKFLNKSAVKDFDELYKLFHQVLAIPVSERTEIVNKKFSLVPYLNSSLFEISDLESETIKVNSLDDNTPIELYKNTVLKDKSGKRRQESLPVLHYLYEFLDAYDFTSEGKEEIQEDKKTLINASVLGLIFEKINGYKDGSFFTPGFITMYMCRETLTRSVVSKFNDKFSWTCESLSDLKNHLSQKKNAKDILEFNSVINSIKICDPAVGSGHFLVSALNELIAIKSELGLLADSKGEILSGYYANVENDELIISHNNGEDIFEYHSPKTPTSVSLSLSKTRRGAAVEVQRVQETLFQEKQTIIENCLFGVDINPNSVKIARLRLWIELLKNAFYTKESSFTELETLPNIDINIKEGNSLISRFDVNDNIFPSGERALFETYKINVLAYKDAEDRESRRSLKSSIERLKNKFKGFYKDPVYSEKQKLNKLVDKFHNLNTETIFDNDLTLEEKKNNKNKTNTIEKEIEELSLKVRAKEIEYEQIYSNAFEWRFEFPEVLDADGKFLGFDLVIGNPPYGRYLEMSESLKAFMRQNMIYGPTADISECFIRRVVNSLINNKSQFSFIVPKGLSYVNNWREIRDIFLDQFEIYCLIDTSRAFDEALYEMMIFHVAKIKHTSQAIKCGFLTKDQLGIFSLDRTFYSKDRFYLGFPENYLSILTSITKRCSPVSNYMDFWYGKGGMTPLISKAKKGIKLLTGKEIQRYSFKNNGETWYLNKKYLNDDDKKTINVEKVVVQDIVAHITQPNPHIKITASIDTENRFCLNTVMCFSENEKGLKNKTLLALLNSKFISFYYYYFIYNQAIRTMHFMPGYADLLPIPGDILNKQNELVRIVDKILIAKKNNPFTDTTQLESEIDKLVYQLYGLTEEEIKIVEGNV